MNISIREATIEDLKEIQNLNYQLFELEHNNFDSNLNTNWTFSTIGENYFKDIIQNGVVLLALDNHKIIGYMAGSINIQLSYMTNSLAELDNCYIEEAYRNQGIGKKLLEKFKQYCISQVIKEIKVTASAKNISARKFYENNNFEDFEITYKMKLGEKEE